MRFPPIPIDQQHPRLCGRVWADRCQCLRAPQQIVDIGKTHYAAWLGLTPKDHSTAGRHRLGVITRAGDEELRRVLVVGATAVIQQVRRGRRKASPWLAGLLSRKKPKHAAVALANKMARIRWKLMVSSQRYTPHASRVAAIYASID